VMEAVTDRSEGLFPKPNEIQMRCSCPDYAGMCKHVAAVMYGIGNRLDTSPELLFELRGVDHKELIEQAIPIAPTRAKKLTSPTIESAELGAIFDIEIDDEPAPEPPKSKTTTKTAPKVKKAPAATLPARASQAVALKSTKVGTTAEKTTAPVKKATATSKKKPTKASRKR
jgi:uncharacterized Zn finger protein